MKIFIGNLGTHITTDHLFALFSGFGIVMAANVPKDNNGNPRGFGYVVMASGMEAEKAIAALNKKAFRGRYIAVSQAIYSDHA